MTFGQFVSLSVDLDRMIVYDGRISLSNWRGGSCPKILDRTISWDRKIRREREAGEVGSDSLTWDISTAARAFHIIAAGGYFPNHRICLPHYLHSKATSKLGLTDWGNFCAEIKTIAHTLPCPQIKPKKQRFHGMSTISAADDGLICLAWRQFCERGMQEVRPENAGGLV